MLKALQEKLPLESFVYLGDTARTPYGSKSPQTIKRYAQECAEFLNARNVKLLVVACNTASAYALSQLEKDCACPVIGTVSPIVSQIKEQGTIKRVAVIGTEATVASQVYQKALGALSPEVQIFAKACPLFVPLVEQGMFSGDIVDKVVEFYLSDFKEAEVEAIVLGCTHYPLLKASIGRYFGPEIEIVECSNAIAGAVSSVLERSGLVGSNPRAQTEYFVTDRLGPFGFFAGNYLKDKEVKITFVEDLA